MRKAATTAVDAVLKITCGAKKSIAFNVEQKSVGIQLSLRRLIAVKMCHSAQNLETEAKLAMSPPTWKKPVVKFFDKPVVRST